MRVTALRIYLNAVSGSHLPYLPTILLVNNLLLELGTLKETQEATPEAALVQGLLQLSTLKLGHG